MELGKVVLNFNGPREDLVIGAIEPDPTSHPQVNNSNLQNVSKTPSQTFGTMNISPPPLFTHLSKNIKPVAIKSRQQSQANAAFIKEEIANLYQRGVIRPSVSPWRAQPFVTKEDSTHKRQSTCSLRRISNAKCTANGARDIPIQVLCYF